MELCVQQYLHYITLSSFHTPFTPKVTGGASATLCTTGSVCERKQMSFQLLFESTGISVSFWRPKGRSFQALCPA